WIRNWVFMFLDGRKLRGSSPLPLWERVARCERRECRGGRGVVSASRQRREYPSPNRARVDRQRSPLPQGGRAHRFPLRRIFPTASFRGLRDRRLAPEVDHGERGADALGGAVLEADHGIDRDVALAAIDGIDDVGVFLV